MYSTSYENGVETYETSLYTITVSRNILTGGNKKGLFEVAVWASNNILTLIGWLNHKEVAAMLEYWIGEGNYVGN